MFFDTVHDPIARTYLAWHEDYLRQVRRPDARGHAQGIPEAVLFVNHSANRTWYYPNMYMGEYPLHYASAVDIPSVELYWDVPGDPLYQQFVYAFMQGITRERGASVWIQPSAHGISGISSPVEIQLRGLECLPWGVTPEFIESTGREEYYKLHVANIKEREEWLKKSEAIPYLGIVASEQTRTLYAQAALPVYFSHTLGAFRAFLEKHLPVRVLTEQDLEDANLQGVRVLVLAERGLHVGSRGRGRAPVRQGRRRPGRHLRDVALRRTLPEAPGLCSGRPVPRELRRHQHGQPADREPLAHARRCRTRSSTTR